MISFFGIWKARRAMAATMIMIRRKEKKKKNHLYPQIFSVKHTPAVLQGNAFVSVENKAIVTLAPFEASFGTSKLAYEVSAGPSARPGAQLIVTV